MWNKHRVRIYKKYKSKIFLILFLQKKKIFFKIVPNVIEYSTEEFLGMKVATKKKAEQAVCTVI